MGSLFEGELVGRLITKALLLVEKRAGISRNAQKEFGRCFRDVDDGDAGFGCVANGRGDCGDAMWCVAKEAALWAFAPFERTAGGRHVVVSALRGRQDVGALGRRVGAWRAARFGLCGKMRWVGRFGGVCVCCREARWDGAFVEVRKGFGAMAA